MMKTPYIHIFSSFVCAVLLVACEKQTAPAPVAKAASVSNDSLVSKDVAALVVIKKVEPEDEHNDHDGHQPHHNEKNSEHRELGAHVHGAASMNLVLENSLLSISMSIPVIDAVGFERPAVNADEQTILKKVLRSFQHPDALFLLSKNADCHLLNGAVETALLNKEAKPGSHADFDISYQWQCKNPEALKQVNLQLFTHFVHLKKIQASWVVAEQQGAAELVNEKSILLFQ
jgi:Protein of unknown function (DUF2796)